MLKLLQPKSLLLLTSSIVLVFKSDPVQPIRTITEHDPNNSSKPLLRWPNLQIQPYVWRLACVDEYYHPNWPDVYQYLWYWDDILLIPTRKFNASYITEQDNATDPYWKLIKVNFRPMFSYPGVWRCQYKTEFMFRGQKHVEYSPKSEPFTIQPDGRPLNCGYTWFNPPQNYLPWVWIDPFRSSKRKKRQGKVNKTRYLDTSEKKMDIWIGNETETRIRPNLGKLYNGRLISNNYFPWVVSIKFWAINPNGTRVALKCSGAFIRYNWVIAAYHCFPGDERSFVFSLYGNFFFFLKN